MNLGSLALRALGLGGLAVLFMVAALLLLPDEDLAPSLELRRCYRAQSELASGKRPPAVDFPPACAGSLVEVPVGEGRVCLRHGFVRRPPGMGPSGNSWMDQPGDGTPVLLPSPREQLIAYGITDPTFLARALPSRLRFLAPPRSETGWIPPEIEQTVLLPLAVVAALVLLRLLSASLTAAQGGERPPPETLEEAVARHGPEIGARRDEAAP